MQILGYKCFYTSHKSFLIYLLGLLLWNPILGQAEDKELLKDLSDINGLSALLEVNISPDSAMIFDGRSPRRLDTVYSPHGVGVILGNNDQDAIFLPSQTVDSLGDFSISFYVKLNGLNNFNNILSFANKANYHELIIAYNALGIWDGLLITGKKG